MLYGKSLQIECPTGSGIYHLGECAEEIQHLLSTFSHAGMTIGGLSTMETTCWTLIHIGRTIFGSMNSLTEILVVALAPLTNVVGRA